MPYSWLGLRRALRFQSFFCRFYMNILRISLSYLRANMLSTTLNITLLGFGVSVIVVLLLLVSQIEEKFVSNASGIQMVVGAKGSPMQLILSAVYHIDYPTGNITVADAEKVSKNPLVKRAIPIGLGDSYRTFRIVGTYPSFYEHYNCQLAAGQWWQKPMEAVIGSEVAALTSLKVGDKFVGLHGLDEGGHAHDAAQYTVVGIMQQRGLVTDRLILTAMESVWQVHHEAEQTPKPDSLQEYTALLLQYRSTMAAITLPRMVNKISNLQAAVPAREISRLFNLIGIGADLLTYFGYAIISISLLSMFGVLYNALKERQFDIALMRTLGASRRKVFLLIVFEGLLLAWVGTALGLALGHGGIGLFTSYFVTETASQLTALLWLPEEYLLIAAATLAGFLAALLPAWQAYKLDIADTLAK